MLLHDASMLWLRIDTGETAHRFGYGGLTADS
jgi:hypothetical protein